MKATLSTLLGNQRGNELTVFKAQPGIQRLWRATGVSEAEFDKFYLPMLMKLMAAAPNDHYRSDMCKLMRGVLVARGGSLLGKGLAIEDAKRWAEHYTLGLAFIVAAELYLTLEEGQGGPHGHARPVIMISALLLNHNTLQLLYDCKPVYQAICAYFVDKDNSEYQKLLTLYFSRENNRTLRYLIEPGRAEISPHAKGLAHDYVQWLRHALTDSNAINQPHSPIHVTPDKKLFLKTPDAFKAVAEQHGKTTRDIIHRLHKKNYLADTRGKKSSSMQLNGEPTDGVIFSKMKHLCENEQQLKASEYLAHPDTAEP